MNKTSTSPWRAGLWIAVGLVAAAIGLWFKQHLNRTEPMSLEVAAVYPIHRPLATFTLQDIDGHDIHREQLKGHYSLVFFGYTQCPDVCPTTLIELNQVVHALADLPVDRQPAVLFVSVDPKRDTSAILKNYVLHFNPAFNGLSGSDAELTALAHSLGALYTRNTTADGSSSVDHSASLFLVDRSASLLAVFPAPHVARSIEADYRRIVSSDGRRP